MIDKQGVVPVYLQIANAISNLIQSGTLPPGSKIQPTRELAENLHVHRKTVTAAYDELTLQGWLQTKPRKGFFVENRLPVSSAVELDNNDGNMYPAKTGFNVSFPDYQAITNVRPGKNYKYIFDEGFPDVRLAPVKELIGEYYNLGKEIYRKKLLSYSDKRGSPALRKAIAKDLGITRGIPLTEDNIFLTKGAQMGLFMIASLLLKPGDNVIVGDPNYFMINLMFERLGVNLLHVPVDENGIDVDEVERICSRQSVRLIYVIPHHHHPTTVTLSVERRRKLLQIAADNNIAIVEDDYDFDIHYSNRPILPMASIDRNGNVIYVGTLTKTLAPAIRLGFIAAPENLIGLLAKQRFLIDLQGDTFLEEVVAELYRNGTIERHMKKIRRIYKERRDVFCNEVISRVGEHLSFRIPEGGMSAWIKFKGVDTKVVSQIAKEYGLYLNDGKKHNTGLQDHNAMCIGFASMSTDELRQAIDLFELAVVEAVQQHPDVS